MLIFEKLECFKSYIFTMQVNLYLGGEEKKKSSLYIDEIFVNNHEFKKCAAVYFMQQSSEYFAF